MSAHGDEAVVRAVSPESEGHDEAGPPAPESHVRLVASDPPLLRLEINVYSWELGDGETQVIVPRRGELADLLRWAPLEQRRVICGNLRARIQQELAEVFAVLEAWPPEGTDIPPSSSAHRPES